jgi:hypothetical protein
LAPVDENIYVAAERETVAAKMTENGKFTNTAVDGNLCIAAVTY